MIAASAILMYASFKLDDRHSVFGLFMFLMSLLNLPMSIFTAVAIADVRNFADEWVSVISYDAFGYFIVFLVALLYFGVVVYMNDAFELVGNGEEQNQFNWQKDGEGAV